MKSDPPKLTFKPKSRFVLKAPSYEVWELVFVMVLVGLLTFTLAEWVVR